MGFTTIDLIIVVVYLAASTGLGAWIGRKQRNTTDYFLADRQIPWPAVTFTIVATETSVLTFISIPAVSYLKDLTFLQIVFRYMLGRIFVALFIAPAYYKGKMKTAYHFLGERFGQKMLDLFYLYLYNRILIFIEDGYRLLAII